MGLEKIRTILAQKIEVREGGRLVIFNTRVVKSHVYELTGIKISICHKPSSADPTHTGIFPVTAYKYENKQNIMHDMALALSRATWKYPHTVYPTFDDK